MPLGGWRAPPTTSSSCGGWAYAAWVWTSPTRTTSAEVSVGRETLLAGGRGGGLRVRVTAPQRAGRKPPPPPRSVGGGGKPLWGGSGSDVLRAGMRAPKRSSRKPPPPPWSVDGREDSHPVRPVGRHDWKGPPACAPVC